MRNVTRARCLHNRRVVTRIGVMLSKDNSPHLRIPAATRHRGGPVYVRINDPRVISFCYLVLVR